MKLHKVNYSQNMESKGKNPWSVMGLVFGDKINLIAGKNATGKTRVISIVNNLAKNITQKNPILVNGNWKLEFKMEDKKILEYILIIEKNKVTKEEILINNKKKLYRNKKAEIYSETQKEFIEIGPPADKLVLHVRRDEKEYPFLEYLIKWASSLKGFSFVKEGKNIDIIGKIENLETLNAVPTVLEEKEMDGSLINTIITEFNLIGYQIEATKADVKPGLPPNIKLLTLKEKGIKWWIDQSELSDGMFRALALLIIVNYLISKKETGTILIDDFCEGLDFERATKFTKLLLNKFKNTNIQLIITSNDENLINITDIKDWNVLVRKYSKVRAYNYVNSKERFDDFIMTGLSNIDLLISDYVTRTK